MNGRHWVRLLVLTGGVLAAALVISGCDNLLGDDVNGVTSETDSLQVDTAAATPPEEEHDDWPDAYAVVGLMEGDSPMFEKVLTVVFILEEEDIDDDLEGTYTVENLTAEPDSTFVGASLQHPFFDDDDQPLADGQVEVNIDFGNASGDDSVATGKIEGTITFEGNQSGNELELAFAHDGEYEDLDELFDE